MDLHASTGIVQDSTNNIYNIPPGSTGHFIWYLNWPWRIAGGLPALSTKLYTIGVFLFKTGRACDVNAEPVFKNDKVVVTQAEPDHLLY